MAASCKAACSSRVGGHQNHGHWGRFPKRRPGRSDRSIAGQPKIANVNSDVSQAVEIGKLNYMASDKMIDPRLCFCLNISKMHV